MNFGPAPLVSAHTGRHPLLPRQDRDAESKRPPVPSVPRTQRAAPKANSRGALSRDMFPQRPSSTPSRSSEFRRPRSDSPFAYARVHALSRERRAAENQVMEMGSQLKEETRDDFKRPQVLGSKRNGQVGMPWNEPSLEIHHGPARRSMLKKEMAAANQDFEWGPPRPVADFESNYHPRIDLLRREDAQPLAQVIEVASSVATKNLPTKDEHGRRNLLAREHRAESLDMPRARVESDVPFFGRKNILVHEHGIVGPQKRGH